MSIQHTLEELFSKPCQYLDPNRHSPVLLLIGASIHFITLIEKSTLLLPQLLLQPLIIGYDGHLSLQVLID